MIRVADRIAYGSRAAPYEALSDFSRRLGETPTSGRPAPRRRRGGRPGRGGATRGRDAGGATAPTSRRPPGVGGVPMPPSPTSSTCVSDGAVLGTIQVDVLRKRPLRASDERLLTALADQAGGGLPQRRDGGAAGRPGGGAGPDHPGPGGVPARLVEADVVVRRELEEAISREVLPRLVALPDQLRTRAIGDRRGRHRPGLEPLVASTNAALEALRELTRGVFPTQLARVGTRAGAAHLPGSHRPGAEPAGRRCGELARRFSTAGGDGGLLQLRRGDRLGAASISALAAAGDWCRDRRGGRLHTTWRGPRPGRGGRRDDRPGPRTGRACRLPVRRGRHGR